MQIFLIFRLMAENEVHDWFRIFQAMWVMVYSRFDDHFYRTAQCQVTRTYYVHILFERNYLVGISTNADDWNTGFCQRFQVVDRVAFERIHFFVCQVPFFQQVIP